MRVALVGLVGIAVAVGLILGSGRRHAPSVGFPAVRSHRVVMRRLPVLPAQGLAVERGGHVDLVGLDGRTIAPTGMRYVLGAPGTAPTLATKSSTWTLDVRRHQLVEDVSSASSSVTSHGAPSLVHFASAAFPKDCFPVVHAHGTAFGRCIDASTLVAVRGGRTVMFQSTGDLLMGVEVSPDRETVAAQLIVQGRRHICDSRMTLVVDAKTLRATRVAGSALGFLAGSGLVVGAPSCAGGGVVLVLDDGARRTLLSGVHSAALWGDAGHVVD